MGEITNQQYEDRVRELDALCKQIIAEKRHVYTNGSDDAVWNFRLNSLLAKSTIGQAVVFGMVKQYTAVMDIVNNPDSTDLEKATRFADLRNYVDILYVLYSEKQLWNKAKLL